MLRRLVLLVLASALVAGCYEADVTIDVEDDGSGEVQTVFAIDAQRLESAAGALSASLGTEDDLDICSQLAEPAELAEGGRAEPYTRDDLCGYRSIEPFDSPEQLAEVLGGFLPAESGVPQPEDVTLERSGDGWRFEMPIPTDPVLEENVPPQARRVLGLDDASFTFRVRLPGRAVEHNGDRVRDGFVEWDLDITDLPDEPLLVVTEPGEPVDTDDDGGGAVVAIVVVAAVVVVAGAAAFVLLRRRPTQAP